MTTMIDNAQTVTTEATERMKTAMGEANTRAKTAVEKGTQAFADATDFAKGNVEALVASSRVAAKGAESLVQDGAEFGRKSFENASSAMRGLAAAKSPTELFQLQSDYAKTTFDASVAQASKMSEAVLKIMGEMFEPLSSRASLAADKVKTATAY